MKFTEADQENMAIFPPYLPGYTDPKFDRFMNYGSGAFLILTSILALFFNAVVFYVNVTQQRISSTRALFLIVASSDFLYTLVRGPYVTYNLINPNIQPSVQNAPPTVIQYIVTRVGWDVASISICAIFCISILRFIKLAFPVWATAHSKATVIIAVVPTVFTLLYIVEVEVELAVQMSQSKLLWSNTSQSVILNQILNPLLLIRGWLVPLPLPSALSIILALATIIKLSRDQLQSWQIKRYSMVTILLLAVGNIIWTAQWAVEYTIWDDYVFNETTGSFKSVAFGVFFFFVIVPSVIALYNPLVLCLRSSKIRAVLGNMARRRTLGNLQTWN